MQLSRNWLAEYVELPAGTAVEDLARRLTDAGLAVEGLDKITLDDGSEDVLLEVDVTTNRPDAMNHLGLAREAAVLFGQELKVPVGDAPRAAEKAADAASLEIEDFELCPRYTALVLGGVEIGPSPAWLRRRLEAIGQRSINNIVDVTNYVLWETGQPLHAFDLEKLGKPPAIRVRRAKTGEKLTTLDGEERQLDPDILVIADAERAVALAGVMGGLDSEVTDATRHVLLESAHFEPGIVRRGAKKLGLHTDACHRFERGADPEACLWAAERAAALMIQVAGGELLGGALDEKKLRDDWPPRLDLDVDRVGRFGGVELDGSKVVKDLEGLGFEIDTAATPWRVTVPSWRYYDFENAYPADVYEEVLRIHGFDAVPATLPQIAGSDAPERPEHRLRRTAQDVLAACGFAEAIDYAFHDRKTDAAYPVLGEGDALEIDNPLSDLYAVMRRAILPGLVASATYNLRRGVPAVRLFEIGHVFYRTPDGPSGRHRERDGLAIAAGGELGHPWEHPVELDFYDVKGAVESLAEELGLALELRAATVAKLVDGTAAEILVDGGSGGEDTVVGFLGQLEDADDDLPVPLFVAEIDLERLLELSDMETRLETRLPSRFPGITVDSTLTHALEIPWRAIRGAIEEIGAEDLTDFGLKDRYRGEGVPDGAVNTTIYFLYNAADRSLTQDEVNDRHESLVAELERRFGRS